MRTNDHIIFIDSKGVSHNALVKSFREHRGAENVLIHDEPLVTLTYNLPNGEPKELIDVQHVEHPGRQENNPDLPSYALHAWKYEHEDHLEVPPDHPLHDHPYEQQKFDDKGNPIPKRRPIYEKHIRWHRESKGKNIPVDIRNEVIMTPNSESVKPGSPAIQAASMVGQSTGLAVGHPVHPETVHFPFKCDTCGKTVNRVASHQGGQQWEVREQPFSDRQTLPGSLPEDWQPHICAQADIDAYRESLKPKKEPEMSDLQKAALEPAGDPPQPEATDVATALDQAGPAPNEDEQPN